MVRKFTLLIFIIVSSLCANLYLNAQTIDFKFNWSNTTIYIPLNESISNYEDKYELEVIINGEVQEYKVQKGVDGTTLSSVSTTIPGTYKVIYKAFVPFYSCYNSKIITFVVVDNTAPEVGQTTNEIEVSYGEVPNYRRYLTILDDYSDSSKINVTPKDKHINYNYKGSHYITVEVEDEFYNITEVVFYVTIVDKTPPVIKYDKIIVLNYGDELNPRDFLSANDEYDGDLTDNVKIEDYDNKKMGFQNITASVTDTSGNQTIQRITVEVDDIGYPVLELSAYEIELDYNNYYTEDYFKRFILEFSDNVDEFDYDDIIIDTTNLEYSIGIYKVLFILEDSNENKTEVELSVKMTHLSGPLLIVSDITINHGQNINIDEIITNYEELDLYVQESIQIIYSDVNFDKSGVYPVSIRAYNESGKFTIKTVWITIKKEEQNNNILYMVVGGTISVACICGLAFFVLNKKKEEFI